MFEQNCWMFKFRSLLSLEGALLQVAWATGYAGRAWLLTVQLFIHEAPDKYIYGTLNIHAKSTINYS